jgi:hypothetical protein
MRENNIDEEDAALSGGGSGDIVMEPEGGESGGPKNLQNLIFNLKKKAEAEQDIKVSVIRTNMSTDRLIFNTCNPIFFNYSFGF